MDPRRLTSHKGGIGGLSLFAKNLSTAGLQEIAESHREVSWPGERSGVVFGSPEAPRLPLEPIRPSGEGRWARYRIGSGL